MSAFFVLLNVYFMTHYVWTYFVGSRKDAQEIANEWNEIAQTNEFRVSGNEYADGSILIEGEVDQWVLDETSIETEFVVEER